MCLWRALGRTLSRAAAQKVAVLYFPGIFLWAGLRLAFATNSPSSPSGFHAAGGWPIHNHNQPGANSGVLRPAASSSALPVSPPPARRPSSLSAALERQITCKYGKARGARSDGTRRLVESAGAHVECAKTEGLVGNRSVRASGCGRPDRRRGHHTRQGAARWRPPPSLHVPPERRRAIGHDEHHRKADEEIRPRAMQERWGTRGGNGRKRMGARGGAGDTPRSAGGGGGARNACRRASRSDDVRAVSVRVAPLALAQVVVRALLQLELGEPAPLAEHLRAVASDRAIASDRAVAPSRARVVVVGQGGGTTKPRRRTGGGRAARRADEPRASVVAGRRNHRIAPAAASAESRARRRSPRSQQP